MTQKYTNVLNFCLVVHKKYLASNLAPLLLHNVPSYQVRWRKGPISLFTLVSFSCRVIRKLLTPQSVTGCFLSSLSLFTLKQKRKTTKYWEVFLHRLLRRFSFIGVKVFFCMNITLQTCNSLRVFLSQTQPLLLIITHTHLIFPSTSCHRPKVSCPHPSTKWNTSRLLPAFWQAQATQLIPALREQHEKGQNHYRRDHMREPVGSTENYSSPFTRSIFGRKHSHGVAVLSALSTIMKY